MVVLLRRQIIFLHYKIIVTSKEAFVKDYPNIWKKISSFMIYIVEAGL